ncbi:TPA: hypothetical protein ACPZ01_004864 [Escherichia coli]
MSGNSAGFVLKASSTELITGNTLRPVPS